MGIGASPKPSDLLIVTPIRASRVAGEALARGAVRGILHNNDQIQTLGKQRRMPRDLCEGVSGGTCCDVVWGWVLGHAHGLVAISISMVMGRVEGCSFLAMGVR